MSAVKTLLAGLGGAIALNILHESLKKLDNMPRIDLLGEEAVQKGLGQIDAEIEDENNLYAATLGSDLVSNAIYYSAIGAGNPKQIWLRAVAIGLTGGLGAVMLPEPLGLDSDPVAKNSKVKLLTVSYYLFGALVTAGILELQARRN